MTNPYNQAMKTVQDLNCYFNNNVDTLSALSRAISYLLGVEYKEQTAKIQDIVDEILYDIESAAIEQYTYAEDMAFLEAGLL